MTSVDRKKRGREEDVDVDEFVPEASMRRTEARKTTIHLHCLPHTELIQDYAWCAYTQKAIRFAEMMKEEGFDVFVYSGDKYSSHIHRPAHDFFCDISWNATDEIWRQTFEKTLPDLKKNFVQGDVFACIVSTQVPLARAAGFVNIIELGIGYSDLAADFACFESASWQASVYRHTLRGQSPGEVRLLDTVIPNSYRTWEYAMATVDERRSVDGGPYALFLARKIHTKGIHIAIAATIAAGSVLAGMGVKPLKLRIAGGGNAIVTFVDYMKRSGYSLTPAAQEKIQQYVEEYAVVSGDTKKQLLQYATALFMPTLYQGPFEGVHVEALLSGVPVLTSAHGVFLETIGKAPPAVEPGYMCQRFHEYVQALVAIALYRTDEQNRLTQQWAQSEYSMERAKRMYSKWIRSICELTAQPRNKMGGVKRLVDCVADAIGME
jgi:glycosyltransferase involved in cell wall biosynthesis